MKRVSRPVSQELTRQLSIRHCQLVQCHELREMRRPITGMKNDPRKPLIFRLLFPRGIQGICIEFLDTETKRNFYFYFFSFLTLLSFINERKITRRMITWWSSSDSEESRYKDASIKKFIACCTVNINEFNFIIISEYAMNEKSRFSRSKTVGKPR